MAVVFSRRPFGYKLGMFLLFVGVLFITMGFASPYWYKLRAGLIHGGLWQTCVQMVLLRVCYDTPKGPTAPSWLIVVQGLQCVGLIGLVIASLYAIVVNWVQRNPSHTRLLELLGLLSSGMTFAGCVVFILKMEGNPTELKRLNTAVTIQGSLLRHSVSWALGLDLAASILSLIASCLVAIHNSSIPEEEHPDVLGYTDPQTGACVYPIIDTANQEVYYIPPPVMSASGFQPVTSGFQPPAYEAVVASAPSYSCPPYTEHAAK